MWLLAVAHAATLDFIRFELTGGEDGVSLEYVLAADDWMAIAEQRAGGVSTAVSLTLEADDYRYTAVVPLNAASRNVSVSLRPWPVGTEGALAVRRGDFSDIAIDGTTGKTISVRVQGGIEGARPKNSPLTSDPRDRPPPEPVTNLPRPTDPQPEPPPKPSVEPAVEPEPTPEPVEPEPIAKPEPIATPEPEPEPASPVDQSAIIDACKRIFTDPTDQGLCIAALVRRREPIKELTACGGLARPRHQRSCVETVSMRSGPFTRAIQACIENLGPQGDGITCIQAAGRHAGDPVNAIESCTRYLFDPSDASACVKRAARMPYPVEEVLRACTIGFPEDPLDCLARASRGPFDRAELVYACTTAFSRDSRARCLSILAPAKGEDAAGAVRACVRLFEPQDLRFECMDRARNQPSEERIGHCGELPRRDAKLTCIGR